MSILSRNIVFNLAGQAVIVGLGFVGTRLVFRRLGEEPLGILYLALALYAVLTPLLDMGLSSTLVREVASHLQTDAEYVFRLTRTSTSFYWLSYLILACGIWFVSPWLVSHWISIKVLDAAVAQQGFRILALSLLLMLPRSMYSNLLRGVQRMEFNNLIDVGTTALHQAGTVIIVTLGGGLVTIAYCYLATLLLSNIAYIALAARFFPWRSLLPGYFPEAIKRNFLFTAHMAAFAILAMVQMESDKVLVSKFLPIGLVGFYGVAQTLVARVSRIPGAVNQAAYPNFAASFQRKDQAALSREYRRLQDLICYGLVPIFAAIIFGCMPLFSYLLNTRAAETLFWPSVFLCLGWYMNATIATPFTVSLAVGHAEINSRLNLYALFVTLPVTTWLVWKWGLLGAGISSVFYHLFVYVYAVPRWAAECMQMPAVQWYSQVLKVFLLALGTYGIAWGVIAAGGQRTILSLSTAYVAATVAYCFAASLGVGTELKEGIAKVRESMVGGVLRYRSQS
jgi:O-antigen/teichoic acid export membrane protein